MFVCAYACEYKMDLISFFRKELVFVAEEENNASINANITISGLGMDRLDLFILYMVQTYIPKKEMHLRVSTIIRDVGKDVYVEFHFIVSISAIM